MTDLGLPIRTLGRAPAPLTAQHVRDLIPADLELLAVDRGTQASPLVRLRDSHHALARQLALGISEAEASAVTGYSGSRISILKADPMFQELLEFYRAREDTDFIDTRARMTSALNDAVSVVHDRLLDKADEISDRDLNEIVKTFADRVGHGPQSKSTNVNLNVDIAERMNRGRERAAKIIDQQGNDQ